MKIKLISTVAAVLFVSTTAATAGELEDACVSFLSAEGGDPATCPCLVKGAEENGFVDEFWSLMEIDDPQTRFDEASDAAKAVMENCAS